MTKGNIIALYDNVKRLKKFGEYHSDNGELELAFGRFFSAYKLDPSKENIKNLALCYSDMELYELSNFYWFKYLSCSGKIDEGQAYLELATNFFYMDNTFMSSCYLSKKIAVDGSLDLDATDPELVEYFRSVTEKSNYFKVVYPVEHADYSMELKAAKESMATYDFNAAIENYRKVPKGAPDFVESLKGLSLAYFLSEKTKAAIECNNELATYKEGEFTAYCNLSSIYNYKKDLISAKLYYESAKKIYTGDIDETLKLTVCALEQNDNEFAIELLKKDLEEKPYEINLLYVLSLVYANTCRYKEAYDTINKAYRLDPKNIVYKYYSTLFRRILNGEEFGKIFPLPYNGTLPDSELKKIEKNINSVIDKGKKPKIDGEFADLLTFAVTHLKGETVKKALFILSFFPQEVFIEKAKEILINEDVPMSIKYMTAYTLVGGGYKGKLRYTVAGMTEEITVKKLPLSKDGEDAIYVDAYALSVSRLGMISSEETEHLPLTVQKIRKVFSGKEKELEITSGEISSLLMLLSRGKKDVDKLTEKCAKFFGTDKEKLIKLYGIYKEFYGEKND